MKLVTKEQLTKIHVLLNQLDIIKYKADIVADFSEGRTRSSKELTMEEARQMLLHFSKYDPCDRMRRKVFALAYEAGIIYGDTPLDKKLNGVKLDSFLKSRGTVKKSINSMNKKELIKTVNQFESMLKNMEKTDAGKSVASLKEQLNIPSKAI